MPVNDCAEPLSHVVETKPLSIKVSSTFSLLRSQSIPRYTVTSALAVLAAMIAMTLSAPGSFTAVKSAAVATFAASVTSALAVRPVSLSSAAA